MKLVRKAGLKLAVSALVLTACVGNTDGAFVDGEETSAVTDMSFGDANDVEVKVEGLAEYEGKTIRFVAGAARDSGKIARGAAVGTLEEAVPADTFGASVYAYFSPNAHSEACVDIGPVLSEFVSTSGQSGKVFPLTIRQNQFNQLDCARLVEEVPGVKLAPDHRPNFADVVIHASGLKKYEKKEIVFVVRNRLDTVVNSAVIFQGAAKVILKNALDNQTFGTEVKAYINMDGRGGKCAKGDPAWFSFVSHGGPFADRVEADFKVGHRDLQVTPTDCAGVQN